MMRDLSLSQALDSCALQIWRRSERVGNGERRTVLRLEVNSRRDDSGPLQNTEVHIQRELRTRHHARRVNHGCANDRIRELVGMARLLRNLRTEDDGAVRRPLEDKGDITEGAGAEVRSITGQAP